MILWFSGTGNSQDVAARLASLTGDRTLRLTPGLPEVRLNGEDHRVVWVFPIHSWGVPPFVRQCIELLRFEGAEVMHHMVATCGDDAGMADRMWRRDMKRAGHRTGGAFTVIMPNTYVSMPGFDVDKPGVVRSKLDASSDAVRRIAALLPQIELEGKEYTSVTRGALPRVKTGVIYPWFVRNAISASRFRVSDACVECGRCERICPVGNISRPDGRPAWGDACTGCLACYHTCPCHAIDYGRFTRGKGKYLNPLLKP